MPVSLCFTDYRVVWQQSQPNMYMLTCLMKQAKSIIKRDVTTEFNSNLITHSLDGNLWRGVKSVYSTQEPLHPSLKKVHIAMFKFYMASTIILPWNTVKNSLWKHMYLLQKSRAWTLFWLLVSYWIWPCLLNGFQIKHFKNMACCDRIKQSNAIKDLKSKLFSDVTLASGSQWKEIILQ